MQAAIIRGAAMGVVILLIAGYGLWQRGSKEAAYRALDTAQEDSSKLRSELAATQETLDIERQYAQKLQAIATKYEGDKNAIERQAAADLASLRDGTLRLRQQWQGCESRQAAADDAPGESDGGAGLREQGAIDLIGSAAACDAQIRGLQAVIRSDRARP